MSGNVARLAVPAYLLLCLLLGGSSQGIWFSAALQTGAAILIGLLLATAKAQPLPNSSRVLLFIVVASVLLLLIQLLPLPPGIWTRLPGRAPIREGYDALGMALPWLPLSVTPYRTLDALFYALPFLAVLLGTILVRQSEPRWAVAALIAGTFAGIVLGVFQTASEDSWKLYSITNSGAVGFFANRNFFGTLLLVNIPFAVALMGSGKSGSRNAELTLKLVGAAYLSLVLIGVVLNKSLAAAVIAVPVCLASIALRPVRRSVEWYAAGIAVVLTAALAVLLKLSPDAGGDAISVQTRTAVWSHTLKIVAGTFPFGTGLGSFREVYAFTEDPLFVNRWYVNHAHNDYLELFLELGVPGLLLIAAFLGWWFLQAKKVWSSAQADTLARAATIASAAILTHSVVDYPLRTAAIGSVFGFCLGMMATLGERPKPFENPVQRQARHVRIA